MKLHHLMLCLFTCLLVFAQPMLAADGKTVDHHATIKDQTLTGVVTGIKGMVQIRDSANDPWVKAQAGMKLTKGTEFRTGPRSAVQFKIPPDQTVTLDRLGTIKVLTAVAEHNKIKTDLGMTYGRTRYDIRKAGFEHESTIRSPSATLSVRGTKVGVQDGASGFVAWCTQSRAYLFDQNKRKNFTFGADQDMNNNSNGAADNRNRESTVDPGDHRMRDGDENVRFRQNPIQLPPTGSGEPGVGSGDRMGPGVHPPFDPENLITQGKADGMLRFVLSWDGIDVDLDLAVIPPNNLTDNIISVAPDIAPYAYSALQTASGGHVDLTQGYNGDDVNSGEPYGREIIEWTNGTFPLGTYGVGVTGYNIPQGEGQQSAPPAAPYSVDVLVKKAGEANYSLLQSINNTVGVDEDQTIIHDVLVTAEKPTTIEQ